MESPASLCSPIPELTCFGCCPPIRPSHYDPLDYVSSLRREFMENRRLFHAEGPRFRPIVGYSCWALGFLDSQGRRVGCLLHPCGNQGRDLRGLIDYGNKCRRENCLPAGTYALLPVDGRQFWLPLVEGLNAFFFSSPRANPLFHLLLWGPHVLESLRIQAESVGWSATELLHRHPFLLDRAWNPRSRRYFLRLALGIHPLAARDPDPNQLRISMDTLWSKTLLLFSEAGIHGLEDSSHPQVYTHTLPMGADFLDVLRIGLDCRKISLEAATKLEERIIQWAR